MEAVWYYAQNNEQRGPVSGPELLAMEASGHLPPPTLVWKVGMANWEPWSTVAPSVRAASGVAGAPVAEEVAVCAYSGATRPISLMVKYGDRWVALEHKDAFLQSLREGAPVARMAGVGEIQYMGFWWRALGMIIDWFVLIVPNMLVASPYYYLSFKQAMNEGFSTTPKDPLSELQSMSPVMVMAYVGAMVGGFLISLAYETWMVGKWGATVGKMAIGGRVARLSGEPVGYLHALGRFGAKIVTMLVWAVPVYAAMILGLVGGVGTFAAGDKGGDVMPAVFVAGLIIAMLWMVGGGFGYYMAGWTRKKQALHDKLARTVVVRKNPV